MWWDVPTTPSLNTNMASLFCLFHLIQFRTFTASSLHLSRSETTIHCILNGTNNGHYQRHWLNQKLQWQDLGKEIWLELHPEGGYRRSRTFTDENVKPVSHIMILRYLKWCLSHCYWVQPAAKHWPSLWSQQAGHVSTQWYDAFSCAVHHQGHSTCRDVAVLHPVVHIPGVVWKTNTDT